VWPFVESSQLHELLDPLQLGPGSPPSAVLAPPVPHPLDPGVDPPVLGGALPPSSAAPLADPVACEKQNCGVPSGAFWQHSSG
jgi:hypothetical protein